MIKDILEMLKVDKFYNCSYRIEIAKGKYKLNKDFKGICKQKIREKKWQKSE